MFAIITIKDPQLIKIRNKRWKRWQRSQKNCWLPYRFPSTKFYFIAWQFTTKSNNLFRMFDTNLFMHIHTHLYRKEFYMKKRFCWFCSSSCFDFSKFFFPLPTRIVNKTRNSRVVAFTRPKHFSYLKPCLSFKNTLTQALKTISFSIKLEYVLIAFAPELSFVLMHDL